MHLLKNLEDAQMHTPLQNLNVHDHLSSVEFSSLTVRERETNRREREAEEEQDGERCHSGLIETVTL